MLSCHVIMGQNMTTIVTGFTAERSIYPQQPIYGGAIIESMDAGLQRERAPGLSWEDEEDYLAKCGG